MQDCKYSWMYTYACTSTHYQMHTDIHQHGHTYRHTLTVTHHLSSPTHHSPCHQPSIHPCLVPALVHPCPCHAHYIMHPHCTVGPGLRPAQYAPCSHPYTHVLATCQSKMSAGTQHMQVVNICCASTSHVTS